MGQIISNLYIYLKTICPPCISYHTIDPIYIIDLSSNTCTISTSIVYDVSANEVPIEPPAIEQQPAIEQPPAIEPAVVLPPLIAVPPIVKDISANILNPIKKEKKQSLAEVLRIRYKISIEKSKTLAQEFRTLKSILELTEAQLAECKSKSGRKFGAHMGSHLYALLHA